MNNPDIIALYSTAHQGSELPYFVGKQYGSWWLKTIGRFALPILRRLGSLGMNTATDVIMNDAKFLPSLKYNALAEAQNIAPEISKLIQKGASKGVRKKKRRVSINKRMIGRGTIFQ